MRKSKESLHSPSSCLQHHYLTPKERNAVSFIWEEPSLPPFDELLISWSASRPYKGHLRVQVSVFTSEWSPWLDYVVWGAKEQYSFNHEIGDVRCFQDTVEIRNGSRATGFRIKILAELGANLQEYRALHACTTLMSAHSLEEAPPSLGTLVELAGLSQMALADSRAKRLCSPTSLTAVIRYLKNSKTLCPLQFANQTHDNVFDIHGNWVLNTSQATHELGDGWTCYVARLSSLDELIAPMQEGIPTVVSVQGPLPGAPLPYEGGHLLVVRGYDPITQHILCMDPAYPSDSATLVGYPWKDFLAAWRRRKGLAYRFERYLS